MPRQRAKVDGNQKEIVEFLRANGVSVAITSQLGKGFPDLVCGWKGKSFLLEIKDGNLTPSKQKLTPLEELFKKSWRGHYAIVDCPKTAFWEIKVHTL